MFSPVVTATWFAAVVAEAAVSTAPNITLTAFSDLECKMPINNIVLTLNSCGFPNPPTSFQSVMLVGNTIPPAFHDKVGQGCGLRIFDDVEFNCQVAAENLIDPNLAIGKCVPTLITGNFAGPEPAQAITLNCGPEV